MQDSRTKIRQLARRARRLLRGRRKRDETVDFTHWKTAPGFEPERLTKMSVPQWSLDGPSTSDLASSPHHPEELVVGVVRVGVPRAYPLSAFNGHHVINDQIAGDPLVLTFCMKCFSPAVFDPLFDGRTLSFRVFGVYKGVFVMQDDQTGTIWTPMTGEALAGPLAGSILDPIPAQLVQTSIWLEQYPRSTTISRRRRASGSVSHRRPATLDQLPGGLFRIPKDDRDGRLPPRTLIVGVAIDGEANAYELAWLEPTLYQDEVAGVPLVLLGKRGAIPVVYDRRTPTGVVELGVEGGNVVDAAGSIWSRDGLAIEGPNTGTQLEMFSSRISEWYAWAANYPDTDVVKMNGRVTG